MRKINAVANLPLQLRNFWHGKIGNQQMQFHLYTASARAALRTEVEKAVEKYENSGNMLSADRLSRYWEYLSAYIAAQNENSGGKPVRPSFDLSSFLRLLYAGKKPAKFWHDFSHTYNLRAPIGGMFWDYFEEFQIRRLDIANWLAENSKGKILDIGAGAHSYIPVDTAADISKTALAENKNAKRKIVINPLDEMTANNWPFARHSFDTVMLNSILSYVKNHKRLLALIRSTLRNGGVLLITNAPILPHHPAAFFVKKEVSAKSLARSLHQAGFEFENHSRGEILLIKSTPRSTRRHKPA